MQQGVQTEAQHVTSNHVGSMLANNVASVGTGLNKQASGDVQHKTDK